MTTIGHNGAPDPIDETTAPYAEAIAGAEMWLDGGLVENEAQMKEVDGILKQIRSLGTDLGKAKKSSTAPLHDAWKAEIARWKPTEDDVDRMKKGLAACVDPFKRKLAEEKEAAKRKAFEEAEAKRRAVEEAERQASESDLEAQREIAAAKHEAIEAKKAASAANQDTVKGLRTVHHHEITDMRSAVNWIAKNDKEAMAAFATEYVRKNFRDAEIEGVRVWSEKEAY